MDSSQLLSPEQMAVLNRRRQQDSLLPPEGTATAYEALNIHIDPDRPSPAFAQIPEGGAVTILGHKVVPKATDTIRVQGFVVARPPGPARKKPKDQRLVGGSLRLPPHPAPPKPPSNWLELSAERIHDSVAPEGSKELKEAASKPLPKPSVKTETKPIVLDDWTLVRTRNKEIGWVLTRNLLMAIPDEVAQYAEGKTIRAFFDLGTVNDEEKGPKHNWLWATSAHNLPYDFDSWRVFLWNNHRHRFETSFRQRDLEGYFPIQVAPAEASSHLRTFSIVTKDDDGKLRQRAYSFDGHLVHLIDTADYNPAAQSAKEASALDTKEIAAKVKPPSWIQSSVEQHKAPGTW